MPALRFRDDDGQLHEIWLDLAAGGDGKAPPLTLGAGPDSVGHIHIPAAGETVARLLGSRRTRAFSFVLGGAPFEINGRPLDGVRVLRNGDRIRLGAAELTYVDLEKRKVAATSTLKGRTCSAPSCQQAFTTADEFLLCPWCGQLFHVGCWLELEFCTTPGCYPIRRVALAELSGKVKLTTMQDSVNTADLLCTARCAPEKMRIKPGSDVLRCPQCDGAYHPDCFLSFAGPCLKCSFDLPGLIDQWIFHRDEIDAAV